MRFKAGDKLRSKIDHVNGPKKGEELILGVVWDSFGKIAFGKYPCQHFVEHNFEQVPLIQGTWERSAKWTGPRLAKNSELSSL